MKADNISKRWQVEVCQNDRTHAENMHINIDNGINGGENTLSGENTHTYPKGDINRHQPKAAKINLG